MPARTHLTAAEPHSHVVQFYGSDGELARIAGDFLLEAITGGGAAVVVATPSHREAFGAWLAAAGADTGQARSAGTLTFLDAAATLDRITVAGRPDPHRFRSVIGPVIRQAGRAGRPVRVYGEMVALQWEAGQVGAALELEALWNDLGRQLPFSLFCAYPMEQIAGDLDAIVQVGGQHAAIVGVPPTAPGAPPLPGNVIEAAQSFPCVPGAPRAARRFAGEMLARWGLADLADDAAIVVTELATNAVVHARTPFTVTLTSTAGVLRICVRDFASPASAGPRLAAAVGHGLGVVAAVAIRWHAEPVDGGTAVWADLRRRPARRAAS